MLVNQKNYCSNNCGRKLTERQRFRWLHRWRLTKNANSKHVWRTADPRKCYVIRTFSWINQRIFRIQHFNPKKRRFAKICFMQQKEMGINKVLISQKVSISQVRFVLTIKSIKFSTRVKHVLFSENMKEWESKTMLGGMRRNGSSFRTLETTKMLD